MGIIQHIIKRNGEKVIFIPDKIRIAIKKSFLANNIANETIFDDLTNQAVKIIHERYSSEIIPSVEDAQDIVEGVLIKNNYIGVAKSYILYRERHKVLRQEKILTEIKEKKIKIITKTGEEKLFSPDEIREKILKISKDLKKISVKDIVDEICRTIHNNITADEIQDLILNSVKVKLEEHYDYGFLAARVLLTDSYEKILDCDIISSSLKTNYQEKFEKYIEDGIGIGLLSPKLRDFNLDIISKAIEPERDNLFLYLGMQTIYDRYLLRTRDSRSIFELPQWMWMRVAMGLALKEKDKESRAIEFYNCLSNMYAVSSTPTLFNSGTTHSQMSSCYINTVSDSLKSIFKTYSDCAQLSKWAGGIGTDWTQVRAKGAKILGTNGDSQGIIPFIKIYNDVALAVNQGGKRKGAMAAYLEMWHRDINEFMDLRKNTGDERRRAHDIHTACFIPDLFMKRVKERRTWTLFSPDHVPDLHDACGLEFEKKYEEYEKKNIPGSKVVDALDLWRKLLTRMYETGHPWIAFKDAMNVRNPQSHVGVIHSSNLCTEITLNTNSEETAVCNLASLNMSKMIKNEDFDKELVKKTVKTVMRMLDNVIDNNFYPTIESENSNAKHRPVGLGVMGYQDALYQMEIDFDSEENLEFADMTMEYISYCAIEGSMELAKERGPYQSYEGSKWSKGILPIDSLDILEKERGYPIKTDRIKRLDWVGLREKIKKFGIRNSNCLAIAPTATISNIVGTTPAIEPVFKNIYMKENLSGNFILVNRYLIDALEKVGKWNLYILKQIKLNNGSVLSIDDIPADIRRRFKETFEIDQSWVIKAAGLRAKWLDQSQSINIFLKTKRGKDINDTYMQAWEYGLKTTYYLRTLAASQISKTVEIEDVSTESELKVCSIDDPDCEACE